MHPPIQLNCVGNRALCSDRYKPTTVQCSNSGSDGQDTQWRCEAEMDADVAFDKVEVSCEGYYAPDDEYVLKGSCGLDYSLKYTNAYKDRQSAAGGSKSVPPRTYTRPAEGYVSETTDSEFGLFKFFLLCCAGILIFAICNRKPGQRQPIQTAPPMNDFVPPSTYGATPVEPSGPGFGAGVAVGAIGGAAAAHLFNRASHTTRDEPTYRGYPSTEQDDRRTSFKSSATVSPPDSPSSTHKSTGFGGTNRR